MSQKYFLAPLKKVTENLLRVIVDENVLYDVKYKGDHSTFIPKRNHGYTAKEWSNHCEKTARLPCLPRASLGEICFNVRLYQLAQDSQGVTGLDAGGSAAKLPLQSWLEWSVLESTSTTFKCKVAPDIIPKHGEVDHWALPATLSSRSGLSGQKLYCSLFKRESQQGCLPVKAHQLW